MHIDEWNIVTGCERLTPGCDNCPSYWDSKMNGWDYHPVFHEDRLSVPFLNQEPTAYMVALGSDLFHESIRVEQIASVFEVMHKTPWHHFEIVTKRIERMEAVSNRHLHWPENAVAGVTVEESRYNWRLDCLRGINARRLVSFGPMTGRIGKVNLDGIEVAGVIKETWGKPRPVKQEWIDEIHEQCAESGVGISEKVVIVKEVA
jgi:protein gp37